MIPAEREPHAGEPAALTREEREALVKIASQWQGTRPPSMAIQRYESTVARLEAERDRLREEIAGYDAANERLERAVEQLGGGVKVEARPSQAVDVLTMHVAHIALHWARDPLDVVHATLNKMHSQWRAAIAARSVPSQVTTPLGVPPAHDPPRAP